MPRGFLVPGHDQALSAFHPLPFNPLHSLVERLRFDPRLCFYPEPYTPSPLDLSLKSSTPITPPATPTPSSPPSRKRNFEDEPKASKTPNKPSAKKASPWKSPGKKAVRKLSFDEDTTSPVSGTIIRQLEDDEALVVRKGDIDPAYNVVEVTEEAKAELAKIENRIGDYICRLCKEMYEDAFSLAQHRCSRIVHVEYRCPECDKVFNCPANLASHQRWHRPRPRPLTQHPPRDDLDSDQAPHINCPANLASHQRWHRPRPRPLTQHPPRDEMDSDQAPHINCPANLASHQRWHRPRPRPLTQHPPRDEMDSDQAPHIPCPVCGKLFRRQAYLRKHLLSHPLPLVSPLS